MDCLLVALPALLHYGCHDCSSLASLRLFLVGGGAFQEPVVPRGDLQESVIAVDHLSSQT